MWLIGFEKEKLNEKISDENRVYLLYSIHLFLCITIFEIEKRKYMYIFENAYWTIEGVRKNNPTAYNIVHSFTVDEPYSGVNTSSNH